MAAAAANPNGQPSQYEERQSLELALAQMETRLRGMISELLQPTIQRTALIVSDVDQIKKLVSNHTKGLQEVQLGQFKAMEQVSTIASFKEEMTRWDSQRRVHECAIDEKTEVVQQKMEAFRYSLEQKESALHHLHRSTDRMATELNHLLEEQEQQRETFESRIDEQSRKINQAKSEVDVRIVGLELRHNSLTDELWGEETGLAKVAGELKKTNASFSTLEASVAELKTGKAEASQLDKLRSEVGKMVHEANTSVVHLRQTVGNVVNDVREHFRTAAQTISAHNATFISEVREQYQGELAMAAQLREEVQDFMGQTNQSISGLDARVTDAASKASALASEARSEVEELNRRRKRDKTSSDNELKALKKRLGGVFDNSDMVLRGIEHIYKVMQMMLESDLMQCSVELQDTVDRKRIALMGVKDDQTALSRTTHADPQKPRPEVQMRSTSAGPGTFNRGAHNQGGAATARHAQEPIVRVDNRCISCSGQAPLVLSAFKMACLQYNPSPVDHEGSQHDRSDLLDSRHRLLQNAHGALVDGPMGNGGGGTTRGMVPPVEGGGVVDEGGAGDTFSEYAAVEARYNQGQQAAMSNSGALRLPNLSAGPSPVMPTPRTVSVR